MTDRQEFDCMACRGTCQDICACKCHVEDLSEDRQESVEVIDKMYEKWGGTFPKGLWTELQLFQHASQDIAYLIHLVEEEHTLRLEAEKEKIESEAALRLGNKMMEDNLNSEIKELELNMQRSQEKKNKTITSLSVHLELLKTGLKEMKSWVALYLNNLKYWPIGDDFDKVTFYRDFCIEADKFSSPSLQALQAKLEAEKKCAKLFRFHSCEEGLSTQEKSALFALAALSEKESG